MKIAFTSKGDRWDSKIDPRFGRTRYLVLFDEENDKFIAFDNREIENQAHGAGPKTAEKLFELDAKTLITGNGPGGNASRAIQHAQIDVFLVPDECTLEKAYKDFKENKLKKFSMG